MSAKTRDRRIREEKGIERESRIRRGTRGEHADEKEKIKWIVFSPFPTALAKLPSDDLTL
jgi:hypothetical protein